MEVCTQGCGVCSVCRASWRAFRGWMFVQWRERDRRSSIIEKAQQRRTLRGVGGGCGVLSSKVEIRAGLWTGGESCRAAEGGRGG